MRVLLESRIRRFPLWVLHFSGSLADAETALSVQGASLCSMMPTDAAL